MLPESKYSVMDMDIGEPRTEDTISPALMDKLSLLLLIEPDTEVEGLGYRYNDRVFYVNMS